MRHGLRLLALVVWIGVFGECTSLPGQSRPVASYRITGLVVNARDNSPVRRCHMTASLVTNGRGTFREPIRADTDESGHFSLDVPSSGNWQLTASAHNIRSQQLDEHEGYYSGVILTATNPTYDVVFRAVPDAMLTGTVADEAGEPVRNAQVALFSVNPAARETGGQTLQQRSGTQTDDRGRYELASMEPGDYMVQVQARPWYASTPNSQLRAATGAAAAAAAPPDPSLDVVYPATWYPGVTDSAAAGMLTAHPGDSLQADFRLVPVASGHLLIPSMEPPQVAADQSDRVAVGGLQPRFGNTNIAMLMPNGTTQPVFGQMTRSAAGDMEISGLAPGTYQVSVSGNGPDAPQRTTTVHIQAGGSTTELGPALPTMAVTIAVDGGTGTRAGQIVLRSSVTGQEFSDFNRPNGGPRPMERQGLAPARSADAGRQVPQPRGGQTAQRGGLGRQPAGPGPGGRGRNRSSSDEEEVTFQVPPGNYEVNVGGGSSAFLTGVSAKGALATGRKITIADIPVHLTVHLASGFSTVDGFAALGGKLSVGAMVLLVPATFGNPASLTTVRRDQTNTDGSFRLEDVIPGQYILFAIDHGWAVHWIDQETLRPYLMHGLPLDLRPSSMVHQKLSALTP